MRPPPKCIIDRSRPCGACIAPSPQECPYAFLLEPEELAAIARPETRTGHRRCPTPRAERPALP